MELIPNEPGRLGGHAQRTGQRNHVESHAARGRCRLSDRDSIFIVIATGLVIPKASHVERLPRRPCSHQARVLGQPSCSGLGTDAEHPVARGFLFA